MGIGYHIQKHLAAKAAAAAQQAQEADEECVTVSEEPPVESEKGVQIVDERPQSADPSLASVLAMFGQLIQEIQGSKSNEDKTRTIVEAERLLLEQKRLQLEEDRASREMQENRRNPQIGEYSYPEGDLKHPKPELKTKFRWVGFEERPETLRPDEIDALNALEPGEYFVTKADAQRIPFRVQAKYSDVIDPKTDTFKLESMDIWFPCKGDARHNHLSKVSYCRQAMGKALPTVQDLLTEIERLKAEMNKPSVLTAV